MLAIGLWAWSEKDMFKNMSQLTNITLDPALLFIVVGMSMFILSFFGCVGALRENTCLLLFFLVSLGPIFILEILLVILGVVYRDWVRESVQSQVRNMIINYRDDLDLKNLVDWVQQEWLNCCGVDGYKDWESNIYFNCSSPGVEACGVPFSCCKPDSHQELVNRHCGFDMMKTEHQELVNRHCGFDMMKTEHDFDRGTRIFTVGCIPKGEEWLESNIAPVAGVAVGLGTLQILGICFAQSLRAEIHAQRAKWTL
ncbi:tetraspanin [Plakobranchus ocellatus]|uniref:Tetraspanin n=1 Tax=Plakobranchus ocellatus TaxID=259542 RepID=A0AAV4A4R1_9GAST|nr:tetraspanin [Plakobranchus ocellatus]